MSKPTWKDITTYTQGENPKVPRVWDFSTKNLSIRVHRHMDFGPHAWLLSCHSVGIDKHPLSSRVLVEAQEEALDYIKRQLHSMVKELP